MFTYNMDVSSASRWLRTTPGSAALAQPYFCTEAGLFLGQAHFATARTNKESYLLFFTVKGAGLIEQGGSRVTLAAGQALLMDCRTPQSYCTAPGAGCWYHYWVHLNGTGVDALAELLMPDRKLVPVALPGSDAETFFEEILRQMESGTLESILRTSLALHQLLTALADSTFGPAQASDNRQVILQAAQTLRSRYRQKLCLANLLAQAHMSKSYFLRLFRRYMGTTPYNYLVNYRITQAKELLVMTNHSIGRIAGEVGFGDAGNFSTRFATATGQSPLQYRKSALQPEQPVESQKPEQPTEQR